MGWGTPTDTARISISASPPSADPAQGAASPALEPGFPAIGTAEVLHSATPAPADRAVCSSWPARARKMGVPGASWPSLVVQAALSLRLVRADTAVPAEATYLWAGRLEWAHWLCGAVIPPFASYFADAPVVYPPLADGVGESAGLPGSRGTYVIWQHEHTP
jgi:hypothetical protein